MITSDNDQLVNLEGLLPFLDQNQGVDFLTYNLNDETSLSQLDFTDLKDKREEITFQIKALQRLLRVVPKSDRHIALTLMHRRIHSALQIAAMTRKDFLSRCTGVIDKALADAIYQNALAKRSRILVQYMNRLQNSEPHMTSARFN